MPACWPGWESELPSLGLRTGLVLCLIDNEAIDEELEETLGFSAKDLSNGLSSRLSELDIVRFELPFLLFLGWLFLYMYLEKRYFLSSCFEDCCLRTLIFKGELSFEGKLSFEGSVQEDSTQRILDWDSFLFFFFSFLIQVFQTSNQFFCGYQCVGSKIMLGQIQMIEGLWIRSPVQLISTRIHTNICMLGYG